MPRFELNSRVRMAGEQAGGDPTCRWEGYIASLPLCPSSFTHYDTPVYVVVWDNWTGKGRATPFTDMRQEKGLTELA
jgi:hypothetical protein